MKKYILKAIGILAIGGVVLILGFKLIGNGGFIVNEGRESNEMAENVRSKTGEYPIILNIEGSNGKTQYDTKFIKGETAFDFLVRFDKINNDFVFKSDKFKGLGAYVTELNGEKANSKKEFWEFSVNGKSSAVGISTYKLVQKDNITFKLVNFK